MFCKCRIKQILMASKRACQDFASHCKGVASIEFAIILQLMVVILIGTIEFSHAYTVYRRVDNVGSATADLITNAPRGNIEDEDALNDIMSIIPLLLEPYKSLPIKLTATNVVASATDSSNTFVCWSHNYNGGVNAYSIGDQYSIPQGNLIKAGESIVVVEVEYKYEPFTFAWFIDGAINFKQNFYMSPRQSPYINYNGIKFDGEDCVDTN